MITFFSLPRRLISFFAPYFGEVTMFHLVMKVKESQEDWGGSPGVSGFHKKYSILYKILI